MSLLLRAATGLCAFGFVTAALIALFPYEEQFAKRAEGMRAVVHLEPVELPAIEPLDTDTLERVAYINIEAGARLRCQEDGGDTFIWNCRDCPMRCFKSRCDRHGCFEGEEIWAVDP